MDLTDAHFTHNFTKILLDYFSDFKIQYLFLSQHTMYSIYLSNQIIIAHSINIPRISSF